jgi:WhiB family redox-sensing transcriptional regulator
MLQDTAWHEHAACRRTPTRNLSALFIPGGDGRSRHQTDAGFAEALELCKSCTVRPDCAQYAADRDIRFGVWGGVLLGRGMWANKNTAKWRA